MNCQYSSHHFTGTVCFTETGRLIAHWSLELLFHDWLVQLGNSFNKAKQWSLIVHVSTVLSVQDKQSLRCSQGGYISATLTFTLLRYQLPNLWTCPFLLCHLPAQSADVTRATESGRKAERKEGRGAAAVGTQLHSQWPRNTEEQIKENKYYVSTQQHLHECQKSKVLKLQDGFEWAHLCVEDSASHDTCSKVKNVDTWKGDGFSPFFLCKCTVQFSHRENSIWQSDSVPCPNKTTSNNISRMWSIAWIKTNISKSNMKTLLNHTLLNGAHKRNTHIHDNLTSEMVSLLTFVNQWHTILA